MPLRSEIYTAKNGKILRIIVSDQSVSTPIDMTVTVFDNQGKSLWQHVIMPGVDPRDADALLQMGINQAELLSTQI